MLSLPSSFFPSFFTPFILSLSLSFSLLFSKGYPAVHRTFACMRVFLLCFVFLFLLFSPFFSLSVLFFVNSLPSIPQGELLLGYSVILCKDCFVSLLDARRFSAGVLCLTNAALVLLDPRFRFKTKYGENVPFFCNLRAIFPSLLAARFYRPPFLSHGIRDVIASL